MGLFKGLILLFILTNVAFSNDAKYYQYDEYISAFNQGNVSDNFIKTIQEDSKAIKQNDKKIKIVMVYPGNQISDYWRKSKLSFEKRLNELNIKYELVDFFTKPAIEIKEQSKLLLKAIKNNTDYLIFTLDASKHAKFIERIVSKKKTKLILQNITTPLKKWKKRQPFLYVGFDHAIGSKFLADYYMNETNNKGNYAVLYGAKGYVSYMRGTKFVEYVSKNSKLKLVHEYYVDFNKEKAIKATRDLLKINKDLKFIYACSTDIALGVIEVLKEENLLGKIKVNGWGGGSNELKAIESGELDITVMRMNDDNGVAMAEAVKLDLLGKGKEVPTIYSGEFSLVKKGINKEELDALKKRAFRYTLND